MWWVARYFFSVLEVHTGVVFVTHWKHGEIRRYRGGPSQVPCPLLTSQVWKVWRRCPIASYSSARHCVRPSSESWSFCTLRNHHENWKCQVCFVLWGCENSAPRLSNSRLRRHEHCDQSEVTFTTFWWWLILPLIATYQNNIFQQWHQTVCLGQWLKLGWLLYHSTALPTCQRSEH